METTEKFDSTNVEVTAPRVEYSEEEARRVIRKLDWRILPFTVILYTFSVLDRGNLGNAKLAGLEAELALTGPQYTWLATM